MRFVLLMSLVFCGSFALAQISRSEFVKKCVNLVTGSQATGLKVKCSAPTASVASQMRRAGYQTSYVLDFSRKSKIKINNWGYPGHLFQQKLSYQVKAGPLWGLPGLYVDFNCFETANGQVRLSRENGATVTMQERVDQVEKLPLTCESVEAVAL
jgi:hypothetical protein